MKAFETTTKLMPHQKEAVAKVLPAKVNGLFMDMGTGKTRTAVELARIRSQKIDHVIWFTPVTLKNNVKREILKHTFCTEKDIYVFDDKTNARNTPDAMWYIVGIESMSSSARVVFALKNIVSDQTFVVLDESSYIKGHNSKRTKRITLFCEHSRYRTILTGTPITQGVVDLFSQMRFLSPKILGYRSFYSFAANHLVYSDKHKGLIIRSLNIDYLAKKIQPYVYQVTKEECLDLPPKRYKTFCCSMTKEQHEAYERAKDEILFEIDLEDFESYTIFRLFSALQGITCGFWNRRVNQDLKEESEHEFMEIKNNRMKTLMEAVESIPPEEKVIIWTKYRYSLEQIVKRISTKYGKETVAILHGGLNKKRKEAEEEKFRERARFLIATQATGSHGFTFNEAHYVIFYANNFKYSERLQAEDRCHRVGQKNTVLYIDIECSESIDERINSSLARKENAVMAFKREVDKVKATQKKKLRELVMSL
ncbi:DEAD/DEAH box helicase [Aminobacterium sp. UBA5514]|uniref:DEAD/DEAH box helicase n=1 Tax=Aminobacterium sp. UBA5514 TaxID=1946036 RepID=UPI00257ADC8C|nr:DEAD/DEAH box helicase [Aminobacterium sp. UBA5514]